MSYMHWRFSYTCDIVCLFFFFNVFFIIYLPKGKRYFFLYWSCMLRTNIDCTINGNLRPTDTHLAGLATCELLNTDFNTYKIIFNLRFIYYHIKGRIYNNNRRWVRIEGFVHKPYTGTTKRPLVMLVTFLSKLKISHKNTSEIHATCSLRHRKTSTNAFSTTYINYLNTFLLSKFTFNFLKPTDSTIKLQDSGKLKVRAVHLNAQAFNQPNTHDSFTWSPS